MVGNRDLRSAQMFIDDVASRLVSRVQLTTDGLRAYLEAVEGAFGADIDYAQLIKMYGATQEETRYSPAECIGTQTRRISGTPDSKFISTSYSERQNLTMRMCMRRFTRLTNGFSKKIENHAYAVALYSCIIISAVFTPPCASRPLWKRGSQIISGVSRSC